MILSRVVLHDFGPFKGTVVVDLAPREQPVPRPICLIGGLNGGGKTSILDGLLLALYGPRARCSKRGQLAYQDYLRQCIHEHADPSTGAMVEVEILRRMPSGIDRLRVTRSWRATPAGMSLTLVVHTNDAIDIELTECWAERVEEILPLGLSNLFFFDGEQVKQLAAIEAPSLEVTQAIRTILGIELPARLRDDLLHIVGRQHRQRADDQHLGQIEHIESELAALKAELTAVVSELSAARLRERERSAAHTFACERFTSQGGELAARRAQTERELDAARARAATRRAELRSLAEGPLPFLLIAPLLERAQAQAGREWRRLQDLSSIEILERRDKAILQKLEEQGARAEELRLLRGILASDLAARAPEDSTPSHLSANSALVEQLGHLVSTALPATRRKAVSAVQEIARNEARAASLHGQLEAAAGPEDHEALLAAVEQAQAELVSALSDITVLERRQAELSFRQGELQKVLREALREASHTADESLESQRIVSSAQRVIGVLDALSERLLARKLLQLERLIVERFRHLVVRGGLVDRVEVDGDTFTLSLFDDQGRRIERQRLSAGEQQLLAVAFLWALADASGRPIPVLIDTPLGRMDSRHRLNLVDRYFAHVSHQVVLLSTDTEIDDGFHERLVAHGAVDHALLVEFDPARGASTIREGYFW